MPRIYGITQDQITATIEERGYTYSLRGRTIRVANESGKRDHGEIFQCRDGAWDHRLSGNATRIWETLASIGTSEAPAVIEQSNDVATHCSECGGIVAAGEGVRWWQAAPDDGGDVVGRSPEGWYVSHRDKSACDREREARRAARQIEVDRAEAEAAARRTQFEQTRLEAERPAHELIAALGLLQVPQECNLSGSILPEVYRQTYSEPGRGASGITDVIVRREGDDAIVTFATGGFATQFASPAVIERGRSTYRVQQWWTEGGHGADSYPGPAVPREQLSDDERSIVERLDANKAAALRERQERYARVDLETATDHARRLTAKLVEKTSGTLAVSQVGGEYLVEIAIPAAHWFRGALRAPIAKLVPRTGKHDGRAFRFVTREG